MSPPPLNAVNAAFNDMRARDPESTGFLVDGIEFRRTTMIDAPALAWDVWVSEFGDIVVDKKNGSELVRLTQTLNEGYLYVSVEKQQHGADPYLRRRVHEWVAHAYYGAPGLDPVPRTV
jgi:hypothetical protein